MWVCIRLCAAVVRLPLRLILSDPQLISSDRDVRTHFEQTHHLDMLIRVEREAVVDACGDDEQVTFIDVDANPLVRWVLCRSCSFRIGLEGVQCTYL